ncbi:HNH endonuclease [Clostridium botulinum]|nr:HNH endonuclease [Clostridium botulinum]NFQ56886.1 HNH endonuclease [Clostridium botulinum]
MLIIIGNKGGVIVADTRELKRDRIEQLKQPFECLECGREFIRHRLTEKCCSKECSRKRRNRIKKLRKNEALINNGEVDFDITVKKLIKRDNNKCKICGKKVNIYDYRYNDKGVFVVGADYPVIAHKKPVNKNGKHTWNNVIIVHLRCNSKKNSMSC